MKHWLRNLIPNWVLSIYHGLFATFAGLYFLFPSKKLFVIGVTGTNGKSTVVQMIGHILRNQNYGLRGCQPQPNQLEKVLLSIAEK